MKAWFKEHRDELAILIALLAAFAVLAYPHTWPEPDHDVAQNEVNP